MGVELMGFNKIDYITEYQRANNKQVKFNLHKVNDADIIQKFDEVENKQGYIKKLIRKDIRRG